MNRNTIIKKGIGVFLSFVMVLTCSSSIAFAAQGSWSFTEPTTAMSTVGVNGVRNIKMNAFRASIPIAALLGGDLVAGGNVTWQTEDADGNRIGLNLIGSDVNINPDPYVWNFNYISKFFYYYNRSRVFQWRKADGTDASDDEVWSILPQSKFMYPILTYDGNTHNMYASYGGNDTDTTAIEELGGISKTISMRPDLIVGNDGTSYADQISLINSWKEGDPYYQDGDEDYDPTFVEIGVGTMEQKVDGVKIVAETMNKMIEESNGTLTTRYGDPYTIATDYEKAVFGIYYYVMSNLEEYGGTIKKKNVALVEGYDADTGTYTVSTTFNPMYQLLGTHTTNKIAGKVVSAEGSFRGEAMSYKLTAEDLTAFDFIYASSSAYKKQMLNDFEKLNLSKDQVPDIEERITLGVCNPATPWADNVITQEFPITQLYIYRDELSKLNPSANPMAMIAYEAENWYHIDTSGSTLENVVAKMVDNYWDPVNDLDKAPDKQNYVYNKDEIDAMIVKGINFAKSHADDPTTWMDGSFNINDPIYKQIAGTEEYSADRVTLTDDIVNAYEEKMEAHPWDPDLSVGIGSGASIPVKEGWRKDDVGWWYRNADGTYPKNEWKQIDGKWYHFNEKGYMQTGWLKLGDTWYYLKSDGAMATGWLQIGPDWYYFNDNGAMAHDTWKGDYYLTSSGAMAVSTWIGEYYVDQDGKWVKGKYKEGWKQDSTGWWYQYEDGSYPKSTWKQINGKWYHFNDKGYMQTGWLKLNDTWYYLKSDGSMATGWLQVKSDWYYFNNSGAMAHDTWQGDYYLTTSGAMAVSTWIGNYYVGADGKWVKDAVKG